MNANEVLATSSALAVVLILILLAYCKDIREARYFAAVRRASNHPYFDREWHRNFAQKHKLFWKPCPECGHDFGGHEVLGKTIPHPDPVQAAKGQRLLICPPCAVAKRNPSPGTGPSNIVRRAKSPKKD